jgi:osmotically inducible lipoprotein OsmB
MRYGILALTAAAILAASPSARADMVGAVAGAGTGLVVAGPIGAVAGGIIGGVFGQPFWGPPVGRDACWTDNYFRRHCRRHW